MFTCAECQKKGCRSNEPENRPLNCPGRSVDYDAIRQSYGPEDHCLESATVEGEGYGVLTRMEEIMLYAHKCGYHHLGLAFCTGLSAEAAIVSKILRSNGFELDSVCCKNGAIQKAEFGIRQDQQVNKKAATETACNPAGQAAVLEQAGCEFAILLGLCVGHDTVFLRHTNLPATVLAVKDRVTGHNPLAAIYTADVYRRKMYHFLENWDPEKK